MKRNSFLKGPILRLLTMVMVFSLLSGCAVLPSSNTPQNPVTNDPVTESTTEPTVVTEPPVTIPADGEPGTITAQGSYSVEIWDEKAADEVIAVISVVQWETEPPAETEVPDETEVPEETEAPTEIEVSEETEETDISEETKETEETEAPEETEEVEETEPVSKIVAVLEEVPLTNRELQAFYWMEVASYQEAAHELYPDFTKPLDTQVCPIDSTVASWQQYFLKEALHTLILSRVLTLQSQYVPLGLEEAFQPNEKLHKEHFVDVPVLSTVYYANREYYHPNTLHQNWLDNLPGLLSELADIYDFSDADALALATAGVSAEDLLAAASVYNQGYMYFTEMTYDIAPTDEEVEAYFLEHEEEYADLGITRDSGKTVDMRHILIIPPDATVAEDGTVTASDNSWTQTKWTAQNIMSTIRKTYPYNENSFATTASNKSADEGSRLNGGLYENIAPGQLPEELDAWLFDDSRQPGDTEMIRSALGMHIVYYSGSSETWFKTARQDLTKELYRQYTETLLEQYPVTIHYESICLGNVEEPLITASDLLYPDVAHEHYPEAPLYMQQDYPDTMYGRYPIVTYGCGITTLAMLATYMTDTELTPPTLCESYGHYCSAKGSDRTLFIHAPADLGFYLKEYVYDPNEARQALEEGYIVVSIQQKGYWTRGGHFLLLEEIHENGTVQVRDSNIYNYSKLEGHKVDEFDWKYIPPACVTYWIYHPKQTSHDQCIRCAGTELAPEALLNAEYLCSKCSTALLRRDTYLNN